MKCQGCKQFPPTIDCKECFKQFCYTCDDKVHQTLQMQRHNRSTIAFRVFQTDFLRRSSQAIFQTNDLSQSQIKDSQIFDSQQLYPVQSQILFQSSQVSPKGLLHQRQSKTIQQQTKANQRYPLQQSMDFTTNDEPQKIDEQLNNEIAKLQQQIREGEEQHQKAKAIQLERLEKIKNNQSKPEKDNEINQMSQLLDKLKEKFSAGEDELEKKIKDIESLREQYNNQLVDHKQELSKVRQKYETQVNDLEDKLVQASEKLDELMKDPDALIDEEDQDEENQGDVDVNQELEEIDRDMKKTTQEALSNSSEITNQIKKYDEMISKVQQTTDLQVAQVKKMDEIVDIFKLCAEEMNKEKQLLLLDNEKLIAEVEIFEKFFSENGDLFTRLEAEQHEADQIQGQQNLNEQ